jgi:hypothetical protein
MIFQWGNFKSTGREIGIRAWALATDAGFTINRIRSNPGWACAPTRRAVTGIRTTACCKTFNPLFPGTTYSETIGLIGGANSLALNPNLRFAVKERWTVSAVEDLKVKKISRFD